MSVDALLLARIQFAFTVSFHIIFPALTIGLASYLAVLGGLWLKSKRQVYLDLYHFWIKVFAVAFGMGVVSGLVMAYQFGTNWSGFSTFAGGVTGPLLAYEVLTAFFLEAGFPGVMLVGLQRVGPGLHFVSTLMVALGTLRSATWILGTDCKTRSELAVSLRGQAACRDVETAGLLRVSGHAADDFDPLGVLAPHRRRTHPWAASTCRRAIHRLLNANSIVSRAVFLAKPRYRTLA